MKKLSFTIVLLFFFALPVLSGENASTQDLLENLKSKDATKRKEAADELGARGEKLGLEALILATKDQDEKVQLAAVKAISKINDPQKVSALSQAIHNTQGDVQKKALHLLVEHYVPSEDQNALRELLASIEKLFNPPSPTLADPGARIEPEAIDAIVFVLDDKNSANRIQASATLGILRIESALPRLVYYLRSPNKQMVRTTIRSIGYIGLPSAGADLVPLLKHEDSDIVMDTSRVLGQFRYRPALSELQDLLDYSKDKEYKRVALQAISRIADPSSEKTFRYHVSSDDKLLRRYAIEGFGRIRATSYTEMLEREFLRENNKQLKLALSFSLYLLGRRAHMDNLVRALQEKEYVDRDQAREYLAELGEKAVPDVAAYLKRSDKKLKVEIIKVLGDMHRPEAIGYLEPYLKDKDIEIAQAATDAIREIRKAQRSPEV